MMAYLNSLVEKSEVAVVLTLLALLDRVMNLTGGVLGSYVFKVTKDSFPGCFYLILTFFSLIPLALGM